jgi:hypothetical protein
VAIIHNFINFQRPPQYRGVIKKPTFKSALENYLKAPIDTPSKNSAWQMKQKMNARVTKALTAVSLLIFGNFSVFMPLLNATFSKQKQL